MSITLKEALYQKYIAKPAEPPKSEKSQGFDPLGILREP